MTSPRTNGRDAEDVHTGRAVVERALGDLAAGRPVVVLDARDRENEADLIAPADAMTPELAAFFVRHTSGVLCAAMPPERLVQLGIPLMVAENAESYSTAFTVTVDAKDGISTGISAADRTRTLRILADSGAAADDLVRPGHIFPLRAKPWGVLARAGHTEAAVDLCRMAGRAPVGVLAELVSDDGPVLRTRAAREFAEHHDLAILRISDLIAYRRAHEKLVERVVTTSLPTTTGSMTLHGYRSPVDGVEHVALIIGDLGDLGDAGDAGGAGDRPEGDPLVRVHSECLTGDVFGSRRCDCGPQLDSALAAIAREGRGVVVYLRGHEGRGIGLLQKLAAYTLQDAGSDTVDANLALGFPADARDYWPAAQILRDLGLTRVRLLTNNPAKQVGLEAGGIEVGGREPLVIEPTAENRHYLATKQARLGHLLPEQMFSVETRPEVRPERLRQQ